MKTLFLFTLVKPLLYGCQSFVQVLNLFALQDMVDNVVTDQPFQSAIVCIKLFSKVLKAFHLNRKS
jgi:hypothetical protein